jgi:hypothetical protein
LHIDICSLCIEISDDVTSETSEEITFTKEKLNEQEERSLLVESEVDEDEEDDDIGEDEYAIFARRPYGITLIAFA